MDQHQVDWNEKVARTIIKNLENRRMAGSYSAGADQARAGVVEMIPPGATVFRCGSMTAVGMNKVAPDLASAVARVKHYAAPVNNIRFGYKNPCVETGLCSDCKTPQRICNIWSTIEGHMIKDRIHVKLVGEDLGY